MNTDDVRFEAARILNDLQVSPSELGYRAQAFFAETLTRLGATIHAIARVGHPDVTAQIGGRLLRVQVKATRYHSFTLSADDLEGIRPQSPEEDGYLAILDLAPPLAWTCIRYARIRAVVGRSVSLAMLKSMEDVPLSLQCTDIFVQLLIDHRSSIEALTFFLLSKRALTGEADR